jgi:hypothetical protein
MTFHPRRFLHEPGLHHAGRSLPVMAGGILSCVGGLFSAIALASADALFTAISLPILAGGLFVLVRGIRDVRKAVRLARDGTRVEATVVSVRAGNMTINGRTQLVVRFRFEDAAGAAREGDSWPVEPSERWRAGDKGIVRYDPADPAAALWVGREHGAR